MLQMKLIFLTLALNHLAANTSSSILSNESLNKILQDIEFLKQENENLGDKVRQLEQENKNLQNEVKHVIAKNTNLLYEAPIGAIIAWTPKPDANTLNPTNLPSGWVLCDGSKIEGGIWDGRMTPNLNGEKRFLRGGEVEDVLKLEDEKTNYRDIFFLPHYTGYSKTSKGHYFKCSDYDGTKLYGLEIKSQDGTNDDLLCQHKGDDETSPKNMNILWIMKIK